MQSPKEFSRSHLAANLTPTMKDFCTAASIMVSRAPSLLNSWDRIREDFYYTIISMEKIYYVTIDSLDEYSTTQAYEFIEVFALMRSYFLVSMYSDEGGDADELMLDMEKLATCGRALFSVGVPSFRELFDTIMSIRQR